MTPAEARAASARLAATLASDGVPVVCWPGAALCAHLDLFVFVGPVTGVYRWLEDATPRAHPVGDPAGAAARIADRYRYITEAGAHVPA